MDETDFRPAPSTPDDAITTPVQRSADAGPAARNPTAADPSDAGHAGPAGADIDPAATTGRETTGPETTGLASTGLASTGPGSAGLASTGPESTGPESTGLASNRREPTAADLSDPPGPPVLSVPPVTPHAGLRYAVLRLAMFVTVGGVLYILGMRSWALLFMAVLLSGIASFFVFMRQRNAAAANLEHTVNEWSDRRHASQPAE